MNRRNFLSLFSAGVAGIALEQAIPLGRVWSFPKEIVVPKIFTGVDPAFGADSTVIRFVRAYDIHDNRTLARCDDFSYAAIRANGWKFPRIVSVETITGKYSLPKFTAVSRPDSSRKPS